VLETLARHHDAHKSFVVLLNKDTRDLTVEALAGAGRQPHPGGLAAGGGVIGRVIGQEAGDPAEISTKTALRSRFWDARTPEEDYSFFCVPVTIDRQSVGALRDRRSSSRTETTTARRSSSASWHRSSRRRSKCNGWLRHNIGGS
jgi:hypothetical protein